jgi:hypothetical protein
MSEQIAQQFAKEFVQVLSKKERELAKENDFLLISKVRCLIEQKQIEFASQILATSHHTYELAMILRQWWQKKPTLENWEFFVNSEDWLLFKKQSKDYALISPLFADKLKNITDFNELFYLYASLQNIDFQVLNQTLLQEDAQFQSDLQSTDDQPVQDVQDVQETSSEDQYSSTNWVSLDPMVIKTVVQEEINPVTQTLNLPPPVISPIEELHHEGNFGGYVTKPYQPSAQWFSLKNNQSPNQVTQTWKWVSLVLLLAVVVLVVLYMLK